MIKCYYGRIFERETENLHRSEKKRSKFEVNLIISFYFIYSYFNTDNDQIVVIEIANFCYRNI